MPDRSTSTSPDDCRAPPFGEDFFESLGARSRGGRVAQHGIGGASAARAGCWGFPAGQGINGEEAQPTRAVRFIHSRIYAASSRKWRYC